MINKITADKWERCPICHNRPEEYPDGINHLYGKISLEEFMVLDKKLKDLEGTETVRLDYDVAINEDGTASVWITARCTKCKMEWDYVKKTSNIIKWC